MNKILILLSLLLLAGCARANEINDQYPKINDRKHIFQSATAKEVIDILEGETGQIQSGQAEGDIIVFSFPECPWCQEALPRVNQVAKELGIKKVLLLNIRQMRDQKTPEYLEIFELVKDHIEFSGDSKEQVKINVPTIMVVRNGEIIGSHLSTVSGHTLDENKQLPPLTEAQEEEFLIILRDLFTK